MRRTHARVVPLINKGPRAGYKNSQTWNSSLQGEMQSEIAENELKRRPPWKPDLLHKKGLEKGFNDTDLALDLWSFFTRWNAPDLNGIIWIMDFNFVLLVLRYLQRRTQRRCSYTQNIAEVLKEYFVARRLWTLPTQTKAYRDTQYNNHEVRKIAQQTYRKFTAV